MKISAALVTASLFGLLSTTPTSAFTVPGVTTGSTTTTALCASSHHNCNNIIHTPMVLGTTIATALSTSPLAAFAEQADDEYVYGAVNAPGGIGLAAVLGVLAILTAAVPVILAPGEDAFNEMKDRDEKKWGK
jgi:hypothetical protein